MRLEFETPTNSMRGLVVEMTVDLAVEMEVEEGFVRMMRSG